MDVYNTAYQSELDELLQTLPRYFSRFARDYYRVTVFQRDGFYITPNFFDQELNSYFLSNKMTSDVNQPEQTVYLSIFQQGYLERFKTLVFAYNLPITVVDLTSGDIQQGITPCKDEKQICGLLVTKEAFEYRIEVISITPGYISLLSLFDGRNFTVLASVLLQLQCTDVYCVDLTGDGLAAAFLDRQELFYRVFGYLEGEAPKEMWSCAKLKLQSVFLDRAEICTRLLAVLLREIGVSAREQDLYQFEFVTADLDQYMKISSFDLKALGIASTQEQLAKECYTDAGKITARAFFSCILCDAGRIKQRQQSLQLVNRNSFANILRLMPRLHYCSNYVYNVQGADYLRQCLLLQRYFQHYNDIYQYVVSVFGEQQPPETAPLAAEEFKEQIAMYASVIQQYIIPNDQIFDQITNFREIFVNPNISSDLAELFSQLQELYAYLLSELQRFTRACASPGNSPNPFSMSLYSNEIVLTTKVAALLQDIRECDPDVQVVSERVKTGIKFTTARMQGIQASFLNAVEQYRAKQQLIVSELKRKLAPFQSAAQAFISAVGYVDFMQSAGKLMNQYDLHFPEFCASGDIIVEELGPITLLLSNVYNVRNSLSLNSQLAFITGANSGGKTTLLKSVAAAQIMFQIGLPVAAKRFVSRVFTSAAFIFCSGDDISRGKSTFMLEVEILQCLLDAAGENSLILIDEIGRGTSTADGFGLSVASIEALLERKAKVIAITHLLEVVQHFSALGLCATYRMCVREHGKQIQMLYQAEPGVDDSKGLAVARMCGFSDQMMDTAEALVNQRGQTGQSARTELSAEYLASVLIKLRLGMITKAEARELLSGTDRK